MGSFEKKQSEDYGSYGVGLRKSSKKTRVQELRKVEKNWKSKKGRNTGKNLVKKTVQETDTGG